MAAEEAFQAGNEEFVEERWGAALQLFEKASELDPGKAEYLLHKAAALTKLGRIEDAIGACDSAMKAEPNNAKPYLRKGMALVQKGDLASAKGVLQKGAAMDPGNKSFNTWINKCGDVEPAAVGGGEGAGGQAGKHDEALGAMFAAHEGQVYPLVDTVFEFLKRSTDFFDRDSGLAVSMMGDLAGKYTSAPKVSGGSAAGASVAQAGGLRDMPVSVSASAKQALEKAIKAREESGAGDDAGGGIKVGTQCKNNSCTKVYADEGSLSQECLYHPGAPVFHEGYKYWSCCKKKKTTDFSEFLSFTGCTRGTCTFIDDPTKKKKALCRYDFFQQGPTVTVSIYAKKVHPEQCEFKVSATRLKLSIVFDFVNTFNLDIELSGRVVPEGCRVEILGPKVEITLKKGDGSGWSELGNSLASEDD